MAGLLDALTPDQQELIDLIARAYLEDDGEWPIFDYLEATFDAHHKDAWETLFSLPRVGQWSYGAAWWAGSNRPTTKPSPETEVELTILGMHHSTLLKDRVPIFLLTLRYMTEIQRKAAPSTRKPRQLELKAEWVQQMAHMERRLLHESTLERLPTLWKREPATWGGESVTPDGVWTKSIPRTVLDYEGISTIEEYIDRLEAQTAIPAAPVVEATPSPLGLVASLDFLNMTWRVAHGGPLFSYPSAEGAAKLSHPAYTSDELNSRLTTLGEILRTSNATVRSAQSGLARTSREAPLAPLRDFIGRQAELDSDRISIAIDTLEAALSVRDATQHAEAGGRAVTALASLSLTHPIGDPGNAWAVISARVVGAIDAIREEVGAAL